MYSTARRFIGDKLVLHAIGLCISLNGCTIMIHLQVLFRYLIFIVYDIILNTSLRIGMSLVVFNSFFVFQQLDN